MICTLLELSLLRSKYVEFDAYEQCDYKIDLNEIIQCSVDEEHCHKTCKYIEGRKVICAEQARKELEDGSNFGQHIDDMALHKFMSHADQLQATNEQNPGIITAELYERCDQLIQSARFMTKWISAN